MWSTAPYVQWVGPGEAVHKPVALFVSAPGGPLDLLASDADVTTFLNDRFTPMFLVPVSAPDLAPGMWFIDQNGCLLTGPDQPTSPEEWLALANQVQLQATANRHSGALSPAPTRWRFSLPELHPIRGACKVRDQAAG